MKSKVLIIIVIVGATTSIVGASVASPSINNFDDFVYQLKEPFDGAEPEEIGESNPVFFEGYPRSSQNDRWCSTNWIVHHNSPINTQLITEKIRQKISEFGSQYDVTERRITIKSIDENTSRISVGGIWDKTFENEEPYLTSFMKTFEFVSVEESRVVCA